MKKLFTLSTLIIFFTTSLSSCNTVSKKPAGSGTLTKEERKVGNFQGIDLQASGDIILTQGTTESVFVETDDNLLPNIETVVENGVLILRTADGKSIQSSNGIKFYITIQNPNQLLISGTGNISADTLGAGDLEINITGTGNVKVGTLTVKNLDLSVNNGNLSINDLTAGVLSVNITGTGNSTFNGGHVEQQTVNIPGSGVYAASGLISENAVVTIDGTGQAEVWANQTLKVDIKGSGTVLYSGNASLSLSLTGTGQVQQKK